MKIVLILLAFISLPLKAEVTELSLDYRKMKDKRDPYFPDKTDWTNYVGLNWGVRGYKLLFWDNQVFFYGDDAQVRKVGWHFTSGVHVTDFIDLTYHHESEHSADMGRYEEPGIVKPRFPLENSYGVRFNFLDKK